MNITEMFMEREEISRSEANEKVNEICTLMKEMFDDCVPYIEIYDELTSTFELEPEYIVELACMI